MEVVVVIVVIVSVLIQVVIVTVLIVVVKVGVETDPFCLRVSTRSANLMEINDITY